MTVNIFREWSVATIWHRPADRSIDTLPCSNMAQQKSNPRTAIVDVERKALQCCSKHAMGETESYIDTSKTKRWSTAVYSF